MHCLIYTSTQTSPPAEGHLKSQTLSNYATLGTRHLVPATRSCSRSAPFPFSHQTAQPVELRHQSKTASHSSLEISQPTVSDPSLEYNGSMGLSLNTKLMLNARTSAIAIRFSTRPVK